MIEATDIRTGRTITEMRKNAHALQAAALSAEAHAQNYPHDEAAYQHGVTIAYAAIDATEDIVMYAMELEKRLGIRR